MKIDRLLAITMYLLNRETVSASALAEKFEVSKRTIQRDIDALNLAGIPIISTCGAGGGYEIMDGFKLTKQIAGVDDYLNIITALKGLSSAYDNRGISTTLDKAMTVMQGKEQKIFIDFTVARENPRVNETLKIIEHAMNHDTALQIEYIDSRGFFSVRRIEPLALSYRWYAWYLFAYCREKQDYRLFKLPRIDSCKPLKEHFSQKHENVEELMKKHTTAERHGQYRVKLLCRKEIRQQAIEYLGYQITAELENGDFIMEFCLSFERMWFSLLLGFGNQIEVLEPAELKTMIKKHAEGILSLY